MPRGVGPPTFPGETRRLTGTSQRLGLRTFWLWWYLFQSDLGRLIVMSDGGQASPRLRLRTFWLSSADRMWVVSDCYGGWGDEAGGDGIARSLGLGSVPNETGLKS